MISLCTVIDEPQIKYFNLFKKSLIKKSKLIKAVNILKISNETKEYKEKINNIEFRYFETQISLGEEYNVNNSFKHSIGLHKCLDKVDTEYVMLSDCDIVFIEPNFDEFYLSTFSQNNLSIIGTQMYKVAKDKSFVNSYQDFPSIHNCLLKTGDLPKKEMFEGKLKLGSQHHKGPNKKPKILKENYYLTSGPIEEYKHLYPNPEGVYDTGNKLYLWNYFKKGNWVTFKPGFGLTEIKNYSSNLKNVTIPHHTGNFILYHHAMSHNNTFSKFEEQFKKYHLSI